MCIKRNRAQRSVTINQAKYIERMIKKFNMENCNPISTPADSNALIEEYSQCAEAEIPIKYPYQAAIGTLMFPNVVSRPDLGSSIVSKFNSNFKPVHIKAVKRIFRYLQGTSNLALHYSASSTNNILVAYADADYGGDPDDRKSRTGALLYLNGVLFIGSVANKLAVPSQHSKQNMLLLVLLLQK
jgi:hypothetical protein